MAQMAISCGAEKVALISTLLYANTYNGVAPGEIEFQLGEHELLLRSHDIIATCSKLIGLLRIAEQMLQDDLAIRNQPS